MGFDAGRYPVIAAIGVISLGAAPPDWQERLFSADLDWIHDATGHPLA